MKRLSSEYSLPDLTDLYDSESSFKGQLISGQQMKQVVCRLLWRQWIKTKVHHAGRRGQVKAEDQLAKVPIEGQDHPTLLRGTRQNVFAGSTGCVANDCTHIMPCFGQSPHAGQREVLVRDKTHHATTAGMVYKVWSRIHSAEKAKTARKASCVSVG